MIFSIENLGILEKAKVDLDNDFILLCGHNNTGKSYLAYGIYHLLTMKHDSSLPDEYSLKDIKLYSPRLEDNLRNKIAEGKWVGHKFSINLLDIFRTGLSQTNFFEHVGKLYQDTLGHFFAFPNHVSFSATKVDIALSEKEIEQKIRLNSFEFISALEIVSQEVQLSVSKQANSAYLSLTFGIDNAKNYGEPLTECMVGEIFAAIVDSIFNFRAYIAPAERSAINIFSRELSLIKNQLFTRLLKSNKNSTEMFDLLRRRVERYPKPLRDNLSMAEDLLILSKKTSQFAHLAEELEQRILKGKISISPESEVKYTPFNAPTHSLEVPLTSSLVKSLSNLVFYFRYLAKAGDYIIIDEPELNLHPDNQILMARFLGRLVNEGFKVIASTHSDYIVREINNLIMLSTPDEQTADFIKKYGYTNHQLLKPEQIGAYLFEEGSQCAETIEVSETGLEIETIDQVVKKLNQSSQDIYFSVFD